MSGKTEVTRDEYYCKEKEKAQYESQVNTCEKKMLSLNSRIAALENAIRQMTEVDSRFSKEAGRLEDLISDDYKFKGEQHDKLLVSEGDRIVASAERGRTLMNRVLDDLEWAKYDLQKERNEQDGLLGKLRSLASYAGTWLETHFFN